MIGLSIFSNRLWIIRLTYSLIISALIISTITLWVAGYWNRQNYNNERINDKCLIKDVFEFRRDCSSTCNYPNECQLAGPAFGCWGIFLKVQHTLNNVNHTKDIIILTNEQKPYAPRIGTKIACYYPPHNPDDIVLWLKDNQGYLIAAIVVSALLGLAIIGIIGFEVAYHKNKLKSLLFGHPDSISDELDMTANTHPLET